MHTLLRIGVALLLGISPTSWAQQWQFEPVTIEEPGGSVSRFIYVPEGERFDEVTLSAELSGYEQYQRMSVLLNDSLVHNQRWRQATTLEIALPNLTSGFHRLDIVGWPSMENAIDSGQCPIIQVTPLRATELMLSYRTVSVSQVPLSALPEGLYNPNHPVPPAGEVWLDGPSAYSAAARLISGWSFEGQPRWSVVHEDESRKGALPDFRVRFLYDESLTAPAQIALNRLPLPTLTVRYRTQDGIYAAINALLDEGQRLQLTSNRESIEAYRRSPTWARLNTPETLTDFGISDLRIEGNQQRSLALPFPPHWQPSGPLQGEVRLRGQDGLPDSARLDIWVQDALSGSQRLDDLTAYDIQRGVPVHASRTGRSPEQGVLLQTQLDIPRPCAMPLNGTLWIDAEQSRFQLPHVFKTGAMAIIPRLVADPSVYLDEGASDAGLTLLASVISAHRLATTAAPIPYVVTQGQPEVGQEPSLYIGIDVSLGESMAERYPERVSASFANASLRWQSDEEGRSRLTAASPEVLRQAAHQLANRWYEIPDGANDLLIHAQEGTLVVLAQQTRTLQETARPVDRQTLEWGIIATALSLLVILLLIWVYRRRITRQRG